MGNLKLKKYPKKPKASASLATMERYLAKVKEVDKENNQRKSQNSKRATLAKRISGIGRVK